MSNDILRERWDILNESVAVMLYEVILDLPSAIEKRDWGKIRGIGKSLSKIALDTFPHIPRDITYSIIGRPRAYSNLSFRYLSEEDFLDRSVERARNLLTILNNGMKDHWTNGSEFNVLSAISTDDGSALFLAAAADTYYPLQPVQIRAWEIIDENNC